MILLLVEDVQRKQDNSTYSIGWQWHAPKVTCFWHFYTPMSLMQQYTFTLRETVLVLYSPAGVFGSLLENMFPLCRTDWMCVCVRSGLLCASHHHESSSSQVWAQWLSAAAHFHCFLWLKRLLWAKIGHDFFPKCGWGFKKMLCFHGGSTGTEQSKRPFKK